MITAFFNRRREIRTVRFALGRVSRPILRLDVGEELTVDELFDMKMV